MQIKKNCVSCNSEFIVKSYRKNIALYCSISCSKKGKSAWNKGLKGFRSGIRKIRNKSFCLTCNKEIIPNYPSLKNKFCSINCHNMFMKKPLNEKAYNWKPKKKMICRVCSKIFYIQSCHTSKRKSCSMQCASKYRIGSRQSAETIKKRLSRREMSKLEIKVNTIINKYHLPYRFVGNGKFFLENINPDFVNTNGEKKAIEVYYQKHKNQFRLGGCEGWKEKREKIFENYGWKIIFIEGSKITEKIILDKLIRGEYVC